MITTIFMTTMLVVAISMILKDWKDVTQKQYYNLPPMTCNIPMPPCKPPKDSIVKCHCCGAPKNNHYNCEYCGNDLNVPERPIRPEGIIK